MPPVIKLGKEVSNQDVLIKKKKMVSKKSKFMKKCIPKGEQSYTGKPFPLKVYIEQIKKKIYESYFCIETVSIFHILSV